MPTRKASCSCGQLIVTCEGPDPERISLCQCNACQKRTGSVLSVQARFPRGQVSIDGRSSEWTRPSDSGAPGTFHFCPECGSTVYWEIAAAPEIIGVAVGSFADPSFPPPMISGYEKYGHPWALNASELPMDHYDVR
jgi:hypothetical protein